jgi:hypothetical protein
MMLSEQLLINTCFSLVPSAKLDAKLLQQFFGMSKTAKAVSECVMRDVTALKRGINKIPEGAGSRAVSIGKKIRLCALRVVFAR